MSRLMRFLARCLTGLGFAVLGADVLHLLETIDVARLDPSVLTTSPYTLSHALEVAGPRADLPLVTAIAGSPSPAGGLPVSIVLLWVGAILFVLFRRST